MKRHHIERQIVASGDEAAHFYIFLRRAISLIVVHTDAYVEKMQVMPLSQQAMHCHGAINPTGYQYGYFHLM